MSALTPGKLERWEEGSERAKLGWFKVNFGKSGSLTPIPSYLSFYILLLSFLRKMPVGKSELNRKYDWWNKNAEEA